MISKKTISLQFNSTAIHLAQLCDCGMRQICISYCLNKTATTEGFVQNGGSGGQGGAGVVGEGCLRDARGGVVADGGEMGSVWGNLWRVADLREWLDSEIREETYV